MKKSHLTRRQASPPPRFTFERQATQKVCRPPFKRHRNTPNSLINLMTHNSAPHQKKSHFIHNMQLILKVITIYSRQTSLAIRAKCDFDQGL